MKVEFGDGCDDDTLDTVFGQLRSYVVQLTVKGDDYFDAQIIQPAIVGFGLTVVRVDEEDNEPIGEQFDVPIEDIELLHIY